MMNLTDVSGRLARWRLRLLEFDFTVKFKKGAKNTVADAVSRLPTYGEYEEDERGVLVRIAKLDGTAQAPVPEPLRQRLLYLAHHTRLAGHPGITRMFYTLRRNFFWP